MKSWKLTEFPQHKHTYAGSAQFKKENITKSQKTSPISFSLKGNHCSNVYIFACLLFFCFLGLHPQHVEVPRLGVKLELQLPAYAIAIATPDPSCVFDLHHSSRQHQILNPLSEARNRTHNLMGSSQVCNPLSHNGNSWKIPILMPCYLVPDYKKKDEGRFLTCFAKLWNSYS